MKDKISTKKKKFQMFQKKLDNNLLLVKASFYLKEDASFSIEW